MKVFCPPSSSTFRLSQSYLRAPCVRYNRLNYVKNNTLVPRLKSSIGGAAAIKTQLLWIQSPLKSSVTVNSSQKDAANDTSTSGSSMQEEMLSMQEESLSPLTLALEFAQAKLREAEAIREALEAKAQEVAIEAAQANFNVKELRARLATTPEDPDLISKLEIADKVALQAEAVAAEAMKAAEVAVKEEMQAEEVVKETSLALEKAEYTLTDDPPSASTPVSLQGIDSSVLPNKVPSATVTTASISTPTQAPSSEFSEASAVVKKPNFFKWGVIIAIACLGNWAMTNTVPGQELVIAFQGLVDMVKAQFSHIHLHDAEKSLLEAIALLLTSCICVPLVVSKVPGGNPVLGYLLGGALVGPYALGIIQDVESIKHLAELGVVFLLFNIGLELSMERLASMAKMVFGMGTLQVLLTAAGVAAVSMTIAGLSGPSSIILGGALAMSSTAVGIQVLEDRGEMGSRHGRAIFSVLLLQDLAVVVLLMLIPLLAPSPDGTSGGMSQIATALGTAAVKAIVCIFTIIAGGRLFIQPLYKKMSEMANAEIFASTTLLVVLGISFLTSLAGLSLALGAFLAGLLIAETEYALQVESDIAPYKGLLLGLFFMSVGMEISAQLFIQKWKEVLLGIALLVGGKLAVMAAVGPMFGMTKVAAIRAGLLIAPGGEFAFVAFGVAVSLGVLPAPVTSILYLVVALSMALIPYLAAFGGKLGLMMEKSNTKALQPKEEETKELKGHVLIMGYGRSGQLIAQLLSENLIPFVAIDSSADQVAKGKAQDLPVYFGDAGSPNVLHLLGAERASCAIIALDTPGANYRAVYAMTKHFPKVKTFVRAHDVTHGINLEKAGATAVVPEILEPSLQLSAAVLDTLEFLPSEVSRMIDAFRVNHTSELSQLAQEHSTSIGYGYQSTASSGSSQPPAAGGISGGSPAFA
ncbi:hypothetical protein CEUSTIGMA_g7350.t1 [Chlamydomonas eustigma]|uniref:RCK N-terminal domain-containing protein n=1 Tax=Chlamydomonas eustigma TaxID=1157962 RepID=A0A250XAX3_9CHLO|nr:hypothetical protein CEUSTIGMA_g7350.t1 [Chlamydomonas eustigma]|eukprot:GAX79910.1 hypothetical protein CEUSTIGMA_g7350.t1 [Chlamydomonas eustigma]